MAQRMRCAKFMRAAEPVRRPGLSTVGLFAVTGPAMQGRTVLISKIVIIEHLNSFDR